MKPEIQEANQEQPHNNPAKVEIKSLSILELLAEKYGTDKLDHGYISFYEKHLPELKKGDWMLEIGAFQGASLRMWQEFFPSGVTIATIESFDYDDCISQAELEKESFYVYKGKEQDVNFLNSIWDKFNLIIQDGSHIDSQRAVSIKHLFKNNLKPGGVMVIEDLHTCLEDSWNGDTQEQHRLLQSLIRFIETMKFGSVLFNEHDQDYFSKNVESIELVCNNKMCIIKKKISE